MVLIWLYAYRDSNFEILNPKDFNVISSRFLASMMMHLNVEKDVRNGISMMKYVVNHFDNFHNLHAAFLISFLLAVNSLAIELTVILVLLSFPNLIQVIMGYVSLAAISHIPRFYFNSLVEHKLLGAAGLQLKITNFRHQDPRKDAGLDIKFMRFVQKTCRIFFVSWSYYFMPFTTLLITYCGKETSK